MKLFKAITLAFISSAIASPMMSDRLDSAAQVSQAASRAAAANPSVSGLKFNIDGTTGYFAGTNSYWIGFLTNNADVDLVMAHLKTSGLKVLRVWGFNDITQSTSEVWFQSFIKGQNPQINTGANGLQRLDYVVKSAESHGVKLIVNFVNNWNDYGGMAAYNSFYGTSISTWYTDSKVQAQYQAYIKAVVSRYSSSTAIFAWELANEPRCKGCSTSVITNWATKTSAYIKSLDPNHMVTLGDEGFMNGGGDGSYPYTTAEGIDFEANLKVPNLDFGTFHLYPESWGVSENPFGSTWFANHGTVCAKVGKPCIGEEYGATSNKPGAMVPWQTTSLNTPGLAGDMFWQYGDTLSTGKTHDDGYTLYYGSSDYNTLVTDHVSAINKAGA
ncbi:putative Mannan endo-1,4-beta-mannosidase A [Venustampulla echinocandica]|uniref:mannan endo-1,4-beta-mannosidase n=1 Tax=Venustampulla echinocandica TaxID=2656787 RepID=A0A370TPQ9_9HELO|nr:putative Mannan endo-1,4-beta-mannosidase A [Venustampulla echinocandica]RDL37498.1 putative Mannan endo-1,4-beta-mannosidase A [Venustampulla echinocandica]